MKRSAKLIEQLLYLMPKRELPLADFARVKNQILDRISTPGLETPSKSFLRSGFFFFLPKALKIGVGLIGSLLIGASLVLATGITALNSVPGEPIYPLKKVVENIQLKFADQDQEARLQIKFADERLNELELVLEQNKQGKLSDNEAQKILAHTVQSLQQNTAAAVSASAKATSTQPKVAVLTKIVQQSALLKTAAIASEGQIKAELQKALENNKITQDVAIENIERAGLKVEAKPLTVEEKTASEVKAYGKITAVSETSISIGTAKFVISKETKFINTTLKELSVGKVADIKGEVKDNKTFATTITVTKPAETETQ